MQEWGFKADWLRRAECYDLEEDHWFSKLMWKRHICVMRAMYVFTDGVVWVQTVDGWQKSGGLNTSSTNTGVREIDANLVEAEAARVAGDDAVETEVEDAVEKYRKIGVKLKTYDECTKDKFEFCSHLFETGKPPIPLNAVKAFYKLCCEGPTEEKIRQIVEQFLHAPQMRAFLVQFSRFSNSAVNNKTVEDSSSNNSS